MYVNTVASMLSLNRAFICSLVPLNCYGGLRLCNSIVGVPTSIKQPYNHLYSLIEQNVRYVIHSGLNQAILPGYPYCYFVLSYTNTGVLMHTALL